MTRARRLTVRVGEDDTLTIQSAARSARRRLSGSIEALGGTGVHGDEKRRLERRLRALDEMVGRYG